MARNLAAVARAVPTAVANPTGAFGGPLVNNGQGGPASPLIASYAEWAAGRGTSALPRDFSTYLAGTFGPLMPMQPQPINQPAEGEDRPGPRRTQFPVSWNMPHGQPGDEGLKLASYSSLRTVADTYSVARACIQLRKSELLGIDWDIVPTKDAEKKMRDDRKARRDFDDRRMKVHKFFARPDSNYLAFRDWFAVLLEDVFVVDALTLYMWPSKRRGRGVMGSDLGELTAIDGTTIRPMYDIHGNLPRAPNPAYQQYLFGVPRTDFASIISGEDIDDESAEDLKLARQYRGDHLVFRPMVARNWTPYGFGPIERALVPIMSGMQRQNWQLSYFQEGTVPGMIISTGDPNSTPNQCRELQDALNAMAGDPAWKHKIIVIPGGSKIDPLRPTELAGPFDEMIVTQVAMAFEVMPMELGLSTGATRNAMGAASNIAQASQDIQKRKANVPVLEWFSDIFNFIVKSVLKQTDMQWHWNGLEEGEDEAATVDVLVNEMTHGIVSIDEARVIRGHQPWGIPMTSEPVYFTPTGITPLGSIDMSTGAPVGAPPTNAMQAAAGVVPGAPPAFGGPPGGPGAPAGPAGGKGPKPKGGGPNGAAGPGGSPTPAHAGAQAAAAEAGNGAQVLPAKPKPLPKPVLAHQDPDSPEERRSATKMAEVAGRYAQRALGARVLEGDFYESDEPVEKVQAGFEQGRHFITTFDPAAALRELDLISNRLTKGHPLNGWTNRHIPAQVFTTLHADGDVAKARTLIKAAAQKQRRDTALAATQQQVITGLHTLATAVGDGTLSTPAFIDAAVGLLRRSIHEGLRLGCGHALVDAGRATQRVAWAIKQADDGPGWIDGLDGRFGLYAGSIPHAYETGYGLATLGAHDNPDNIVIDWHARPDACDMCDVWSTMRWTVGTLPGWPGDGGFGKNATVCLGGRNCRCHLSYHLVGPDEVAKVLAGHSDRPVTPAQQTEVDQRARDAVAISRALDADDPNKALAAVLADLADERAEAQRGWLTGLLRDILTAATRGANMLRTWLVTKEFHPDELRDNRGQWTRVGAGEVHALTQMLGKATDGEGLAGSYGDVIENDEFADGSYVELTERGDIFVSLAGTVDDMYHVFMDTSQDDADGFADDLEWAITGAEGGAGDRPPDPVNGLRDWLDNEGRVIGYTPDGRIHIGVVASQHTPEGDYIPRKYDPTTGVYIPGPRDNDMVFMDLSVDEAQTMADLLRQYANMGLPEEVTKAAKTGKTWQPCGVRVFSASGADYANPPSGLVTKGITVGGEVAAQMRENYPPKALRWMGAADWAEPADVPLDRIDFDDMDKWAASHDPARVKHFAKKLRKGKPVKPVVAVREPGSDKVKVVDGHHRTLAYRALNQPVRAYVGTVGTDGGLWDETHVYQVHDGADPANKAMGADVWKVRLPPGPRDWKEHPWSHGWVWHGPTSVGTVIDHKGFGKGKVTGTTKTRIKVMFPDGKERTFPHDAGVAAGKPAERKPRVVGEAKPPAAPRAPRKAAAPKAPPQPKKAPKAPVADRAAKAKDRRVATMAGRLHEDWRKTRLQDDGSFEPRVKATKDAGWIAAHGTDQVDIANTDYANLPEDWKAENRAAGEVIDNILQRHGGKVDLNDKAVRDQVGEEIHQEWLNRNGWAKGGELDVPFADLPKSEQDKDIDQLRVAMGTPAAATPRAPRKAVASAPTKKKTNPGPSGVSSFTGNYTNRQKALKSHTGEPVVTPLHGGISSKVELLTYPDGSRVVRKDYGTDKLDHIPADSEELAARVLDAFGLPTPAVARQDSHTILMEYVDGEQGGETGVLKAPANIRNSSEGRLLGLADAVMGHRDRGGGNWMRTHNGIVPIDNGNAFSGVGADTAAHGNPFASYLMTGSRWKAEADVDRAQIAAVRMRLAGLRPEFQRIGFLEQYGDMLARLDEIEKRARRGTVTKAAKVSPTAAGVALQAADTGRVLMLQRALPEDGEDDDPAAGHWEFPGGKLDDGETPLMAALREWAEETGCKMPKKAHVTGEWVSPNGVYHGYVLTIPHEDQVPVFGDRDHTTNPDDPDGDRIEAIAWWQPDQLTDNPAVRAELADTIPAVMQALKTNVDKGRHSAGEPYRYRHGWIPLHAGTAQLDASTAEHHHGATDTTAAHTGHRPTHEQAHTTSGGKRITGENKLGHGNVADTSLLDLEDGTKLVRKRAVTNPQFANLGTAEDQTDAEVLTAAVGQVLGLASPHVDKVADDEIHMGYVNSGARLGMLLTEQEREDIADTPHGKLLGLMDFITDNTDRHGGNWIVGKDGTLHPIDNGQALHRRARRGDDGKLLPLQNVISAFGRELNLTRNLNGQMVWADTPRLSPDDIDEVASRLKSLRGEFEAHGRGEWYRNMMERLGEVHAHATGTGYNLYPTGGYR